MLGSKTDPEVIPKVVAANQNDLPRRIPWKDFLWFFGVFYCFSNVGVEIKDSKVFYRDISLSLHSKVLEEIQSDKFISIMTCSDAEKSCPADSRSIRNISMIYQDPKIYDNTEKEREEYSKTSKLIAEELNYIIKNLVNPI